MRQCKPTANALPLLLTATIALALGVLVYITARAPGSAYFLPVSWSTPLSWPAPIRSLSGNLPTFFHTLGFCLILTLIVGSGRRAAAWVCMIWFAVEAVFEAGQHPGAGTWLMKHLPRWFDHIWLLDRTGSYFSNGVFDPFDILAAAAGASLALLMMAMHEPKRRYCDEQHR